MSRGVLFVPFARILQLARLVHSRWLAPLFGMVLHWHRDCSPAGFTLTHSTLALKLLFSRASVGSASAE